MDKCREAFEQIPEIKDSLSEKIVFVGNKYTTANEGFYDLVNWLNGGWYTWQSRQSEFDAMTEALLNQTQLLAKQKVEVEEKDKQIEAALVVVKRYRDKRYPFNAFCIWMEKALRGEHE